MRKYVVLRQLKPHDTVVAGYTRKTTVVPKIMKVGERLADRETELVRVELSLEHQRHDVDGRPRLDTNG